MPEPTGVRPPLGDEVLWIPRIAGEILGTTVDQLIDLVRAGQLVARSVDGMLMFREGDLYALANIRQTHADPWLMPAAMPLVFREGRLLPGGPYLIQINGMDVPARLLDAVRKHTRARAAEIEKLRSLLREALDGWEATDGALGMHKGFADDPRPAEIRREVGLT
jgi:N-acyl-D-aspartate/D-glutamate deacylase